MPRELRDGPRQFDARGTTPDHHEAQALGTQRRIALALRGLEGHQHTPPNFHRIVETLESRCIVLPLVVSEVVSASTGREHQIVVGQLLALPEQHVLPFEVHARHFRQEHGDVSLVAYDGANRRGDFAGSEPRHRHLVEQGLKQMVILAIDERDFRVRRLSA